MIACAVLPHRVGDGPSNMGLDEALLNAVSLDPSKAFIRTYGWSVPTLSLGYFQSIDQAASSLRWGSVPIVRRPTGGGALWHHHEVTYTVVIPKIHPLARRTTDLYRAVHSAIASIFIPTGIAAVRRREAETRGSESDKPFLCFSDCDAEDVVVGRVKLVGSAQRRRVGAILQHGATLLSQSKTTPEHLGAADLGCNDVRPASWAERLRLALPEALGLVGIETVLDPVIQADADRLADEVYRNAAWTGKR